MSYRNGLIVALFASASMPFVQPAEAQKEGKGGPKWSTIAPLQVYDANGQVVGHYLGHSCVSLLEGAQRVDACLLYWITDPNQTVLDVYYETVDCSGPGYSSPYTGAPPDNTLHRSGWIFPNATLVYPNGPTKAIHALSYRYMLGDTSFGDCGGFNATFSSAVLKSVTIGPGPYTVK